MWIRRDGREIKVGLTWPGVLKAMHALPEGLTSKERLWLGLVNASWPSLFWSWERIWLRKYGLTLGLIGSGLISSVFEVGKKSILAFFFREHGETFGLVGSEKGIWRGGALMTFVRSVGLEGTGFLIETEWLLSFNDSDWWWRWSMPRVGGEIMHGSVIFASTSWSIGWTVSSSWLSCLVLDAQRTTV